jgi:hypothetical protein
VARGLHCDRRMLKALILACLVTACATAADSHPPDAAPPPIDPAGTYAVRSALHLATPLPGPAAMLVEDLQVANDPSRYLVDKMIEALPDGETKTVAQELAPFVAAYLDSRIDVLAPKFRPGIRELSDLLAALTQQLETIETLRIGDDYSAVRTLIGITVGKTDAMLAVGGIAEPSVATKIAFNRDELAFDEHRLALPYSRLVRLALDRAIIPSIDAGAFDLATLLTDLVDCPHVGQAFSDALDIGSPALYEQACVIGMAAAASELYLQLDTLDGTAIELVAKGTARGVDLDRDGHMDGITSGIWTGTIASDGLGGSTFEGKRE